MTTSRAVVFAVFIVAMSLGLLLATAISPVATYFTAGILAIIGATILVLDLSNARR